MSGFARMAEPEVGLGRRHATRVPMVRNVKVMRKDAQGHPFMQTASTIEISRTGLRLGGLYRLQADWPVTVEWSGKRARYRVVWVGPPHSPYGGQAGLHCLEPGVQMFDVSIVQRQDDYVVPSAQAKAKVVPIPIASASSKPDRRREERRQRPRYSCAGSAELRGGGTDPVTRGRVSDVSEGGCYVEMMSPFRVGSQLQMEVLINDLHFHAIAEVVVVHPGFGMGLKFVELTPTNRQRLLEIIAQLGGVPTAPLAAEPQHSSSLGGDVATAGASRNKETPRLLDAILHWFATHDELTPQQFLQLVRDHADNAREENETRVS